MHGLLWSCDLDLTSILYAYATGTRLSIVLLLLLPVSNSGHCRVHEDRQTETLYNGARISYDGQGLKCAGSQRVEDPALSNVPVSAGSLCLQLHR